MWRLHSFYERKCKWLILGERLHVQGHTFTVYAPLRGPAALFFLSFFLSFPFAAWTLCGLQRLELYARGLCQAQRDPLRTDRLRILLHRVTNFGLRPQSVSPHDNFAQDR